MSPVDTNVAENIAQPSDIHHQRLQRRALEIERNKVIRTLTIPEGANLKLKLATGGERAGAFIIDFMLIIIALIVALFGIVYSVGQLGLEGGQIALALLQLLFFFMFNFYFILFEMGKRAATPGKRILGLRVAARNGARLTANAVFARNFVREVEVFMPIRLLMVAAFTTGSQAWLVLFGLIWTGLFLFFPLLNRDKLRAGDILAGTWVIKAPKIKLLSDISFSSSEVKTAEPLSEFSFTPEQISVYGIHELHVLEDVLRKSNDEIKASVAERIRNKIGWVSGPEESASAFLEAYYGSLRRYLEQKLLLGERKADKYDTSM